MSDKAIETRLIHGFIGAGKTTYIQDCIFHDFYHKYGTTLILCFEQGETEYDEKRLSEFRTYVAYYDENDDITSFCTDAIEKYHPGRIYVEMNAMMQDLQDSFPEEMSSPWAITLFDWQTLGLYMTNLKQFISRMVSGSSQVVFRGCPSKELLAPYSQIFRAMNHKAVYLRQDPMGYHEKAFDLFLPFSLDDPVINISEREYIAFWLDSADHPEHYDGKRLRFTDPLEIKKDAPQPGLNAGRVVMTCCMADLQYMGFALDISEFSDVSRTAADHNPAADANTVADMDLRATADSDVVRDSSADSDVDPTLTTVSDAAPAADSVIHAGSWISLEASSHVLTDPFRRPYLSLTAVSLESCAPPQNPVLSPE